MRWSESRMKSQRIARWRWRLRQAQWWIVFSWPTLAIIIAESSSYINVPSGSSTFSAPDATDQGYESKTEALSQPRIRITFPANHSVWQVTSSHTTLGKLEIHFMLSGFSVPEDGSIQLKGTKIDPRVFYHRNASTKLALGQLETGTYFVTLQLVDRQLQAINSKYSTAMVHFEVVSALESAWSHPQAKQPRHSFAPVILMNLPNSVQEFTKRSSPREDAEQPNDSTTVCFVASTIGLFDGQKKMWLQLIEKLSPLDEFSFQVKTFDGEIHDAVFTQELRRLQIPIDNIPLKIKVDELNLYEIDASSPEDIMGFVRTHAGDDLYKPESQASVDGSSEQQTPLDHAIPVERPPFVTRFLNGIKTNLRSCARGILVFANSREESDEILIAIARQIGIRAVVMELSNLDPAVNLNVDVLLAPSLFSLSHPSIQSKVHASMQYVLSTGIDLKVFHPDDKLTATSPSISHSDDQFVVGSVGRLAMEKSLGMALDAVRLLQKKYRATSQSNKNPFQLRLIGDGEANEVSRLRHLADDFGLTQQVEFIRGIYNQTALVHEIRQFDVFVLTGFRETLCLAAIEAMACGVPVVTFGGHGPMEFVVDQVNGLVVTEPTASSVSESVWKLYTDKALRARLAKNAVQTIQRRFNLDLQVESYKQLYRRLARRRSATTTKRRDFSSSGWEQHVVEANASACPFC